MKRFGFLVVVAACLAAGAGWAPAAAHHHQKHHGKTAEVHFGGKPGLGYWRRGPETGHGFRFSSYNGDPFGSDDYWDGNKCYYVRHSNYCVKNRIFSGF